MGQRAAAGEFHYAQQALYGPAGGDRTRGSGQHRGQPGMGGAVRRQDGRRRCRTAQRGGQGFPCPRQPCEVECEARVVGQHGTPDFGGRRQRLRLDQGMGERATCPGRRHFGRPLGGCGGEGIQQHRRLAKVQCRIQRAGCGDRFGQGRQRRAAGLGDGHRLEAEGVGLGGLARGQAQALQPEILDRRDRRTGGVAQRDAGGQAAAALGRDDQFRYGGGRRVAARAKPPNPNGNQPVAARALCQQPDQCLEGAVEPHGVETEPGIRRRSLGQVQHSARGTLGVINLQRVKRTEGRPVIQATSRGECGDVGASDTPTRAQRDRGGLRQRRQLAYHGPRVLREGLVRQAAATVEGEGAVGQRAAQLTRAPGLQRHRAQDREVAQFQHRRIGMRRGRCRERHLGDGGRWQHRFAQQSVVGQPGILLGVEHALPLAGRGDVAQQRVVALRAREAGAFDRDREAGRAAGEGGQRQRPVGRRTREGARRARVRAQRRGAVRDGGEGVAPRVAAPHAGQRGDALRRRAR